VILWYNEFTMKDALSSNDLENNSPKTLFQKDLVALRRFYSEKVLSLVEKNIDVLLRDYTAWQTALTTMARSLGVEATNANEIPNIIERATFAKVKDALFLKKPKKILLGIAGPGAVGKETIKNGLGFDTVINTTTRPKRSYENHGEHYHFVDDSTFRDIASQDSFVVSMERPDRGKYGIQKRDLEKVLLRSKVAVVEESPASLISLREYIKTYKDSELILTYILPPSPVLPHLAARLANRCQGSGDDFRLAIASTLNLRQLDEFSSVMDAITKGVNVIFVVNDSVENAVRKVKDLVG